METESSVLAFGRRGAQAVVLKLVKRPSGEWLSGAVLHAFDGRGTVRVLDYVDGALLLERLSPGTSLESLVMNGDDERATEVLADIIGKMSSSKTVAGVPAVEDWMRGFERCAAGSNESLPATLVAEARKVYSQLCASESQRRLLHGDLHHGNVLLDSTRGWLAVDPKGVIGEPEFEVGAALRNPIEMPELFLHVPTIEARVKCFADRLHLDEMRILGWTFAQAVLSAVWAVEDGFSVTRNHPWIALARAVQPMLRAA